MESLYIKYDDKTGTWGEVPEAYKTIECVTKEDYEYAKKAIKGYKELEAKHWDECRQIALYEDGLRRAKDLLKVAVNDIRHCMHSYDPCEVCDLMNEDGECPTTDANDCEEKYKWRHEDEALALIGNDTNVPTSVDGWISVKEKVPDVSGKYLCYLAYNEFEVVYFEREIEDDEHNLDYPFGLWNTYPSDDGSECREWIEVLEVTHWQPLPEPPKDGDTNG